MALLLPIAILLAWLWARRKKRLTHKPPEKRKPLTEQDIVDRGAKRS